MARVIDAHKSGETRDAQELSLTGCHALCNGGGVVVVGPALLDLLEHLLRVRHVGGVFGTRERQCGAEAQRWISGPVTHGGDRGVVRVARNRSECEQLHGGVRERPARRVHEDVRVPADEALERDHHRAEGLPEHRERRVERGVQEDPRADPHEGQRDLAAPPAVPAGEPEGVEHGPHIESEPRLRKESTWREPEVRRHAAPCCAPPHNRMHITYLCPLDDLLARDVVAGVDHDVEASRLHELPRHDLQHRLQRAPQHPLATPARVPVGFTMSHAMNGVEAI